MRHYKSQLRSIATQAIISNAGGVVYVAATGTTNKAALTDINGVVLANPLALTNGSFDFYVADTLGNVDIFILTPTGHMVTRKNMAPSSDASISYDKHMSDTTLVIPFSILDTAAATETPTGFTLPGSVQPNVAVDVVTLESGKTINFGTLSSASGVAAGFGNGMSLTLANYIKPTTASGAVTLGSLLLIADGNTDSTKEPDVASIGKQVSYTLSSGAAAAGGYIILPTQLRVSAL